MSAEGPVEELFKGRHFNQEIVVLCVRWYLSFKLSFRDLVAMMAERARGIRDGNVLRVMGEIPRHLFAPAELQSYAYEDHPLPIGHGATISQPFIVAWMTDLLQTSKTHRVLEIGTGSGYQASGKSGNATAFEATIKPARVRQAI